MSRIEDLTETRAGIWRRGTDKTRDSAGRPLQQGRVLRIAQHRNDERVSVLEAPWSEQTPLIVKINLDPQSAEPRMLMQGCRDAEEVERVVDRLLVRHPRAERFVENS